VNRERPITTADVLAAFVIGVAIAALLFFGASS